MELIYKLLLLAIAVGIIGFVLPISTSSSFNGTLLYGLTEINITDGFVYKYNGSFIIEHSLGSPLGFATNVDMEGNNITNCGNCANKSYMVVDEFIIGYDGIINLTLSQPFISNSTHLYINGLKKWLFYDYNETIPNSINITSSLSPNDLVEVEYEKIQ